MADQSEKASGAAADVKARAFWVTAPGEGKIGPAAVDAVSGEGPLVPVRARYSGISRGTESLVFQGRVPPSLAEIMRCPFQEGAFPAPVKYGYSAVGLTEAGERVFCLFPHQDRFAVPAAALHPVPDDVPDRRAVLAANMETALNAVWDGAPLVGDRIAVVGGGVVGCLVGWLCGRMPGTDVRLVDVNPSRAAIAERLGVGFRAPADVEDGNDLVFHASGSAEGLGTALSIAGDEATVIELSWYGDGPVAAPLGERFHSARLTLKASQVGRVAPARRLRRTAGDRLRLALRFLADPVLDCLLTGTSRFEEMPATMRRLSRQPGDTLCHVIEYDDEES